MIIVSITEINKQRSRILLETEESFVLYKGEIRMLHLKEGHSISDEAYKQIFDGLLPRRAKVRAMNLLQAKNYTSYQLLKKLLDGGYPETIARQALEYVTSYGYVDDLRYAKEYIEQAGNSYSRNEIKLKLTSKGIEREVIEKAFSEIDTEHLEYGEEGTDAAEEELIKKTLTKRGYTGDESYEEKQKLLAYFYRRGFNIDKVKKFM